MNEVLEDIKNYATKKLMAAYGYCGVAEGGDIALLNTDDGDGMEIKITIKTEKE